MDLVRKFEPLALFLMIVGALSWGILAVTDTNVLTEIFGNGTLTDIVYVLIGLAALAFVPRLLDELHIGHGPHPRGV